MRLHLLAFTLIVTSTMLGQNKTENLIEGIDKAEQLHNRGVSAARKGNFPVAAVLYDSALQVRAPLVSFANDLPSHEKQRLLTGFIKSLHNLGVSYAYLEDLDKAEYYTELCIKKQLEFQEDYNFILPLRLGRAYCQLAIVFMRTRGFEDAYTQLKLSDNYLSTVEPKPRRDISLLENTFSNLFLLWKEPDSLHLHSIKQLELFQPLEKNFATASIYINLGVSKEMNDELEEALDYFETALGIYNRDPESYPEKISTIYQDMSYVYSKAGNWTKAHFAIDQAIGITENLPFSDENVARLANMYNTKGYIFFLHEEYEKSIDTYQKTLDVIYAEAAGRNADYQSITDLSGILRDRTIPLFATGYIAKSYLETRNYQEAQSAFTLAINYLNKIRREYNDTESKLKLTEIAKVIFEGAIALHLDPAVNEPEKAFAYAEQSKAFTLLEGIKHSKAMRIAKVPEDLLEQEYELRGEIARLERKYLSAEEPEEKTEHLQAIRKQKEELTGLMNRLQRNKEYRKLMSFEAPSSRQLQRKALGVGQTLVEYFVGEEKTYVFVLPKKGRLQVIQLDLDSKGLNQQVDEFWSSIYHYGCDEEVLRQEAPALLAMGEEARKERLQAKYLALGQSLYTQLFQPIVDLGVGTRFVIVPDEGLSYLPFDALLVGAPEIDNFSFYPYLGREFTLSYAYSGNLLLEVQQGRGSKAKKILAMAPSFSSRQLAMNKSALSRLTNNVTEINVICDIFSDQCDPMEGMAANLESFRNLVEQNAYRIIHLSTHGKANDKNPNQSWISFTQNREQLDESQLLYASDLYALPIQADLVVLSACETNKGRLRRGEGIMSFARGFSAAGVKSVLSTFWVIGEDPSLLVMKDFYEQLNEGAAKDEALQKARLGLMENSDFSHPFYWSAFVPIGQMAEVEAGGSAKWLLLVLLGLLLTLGFSKVTSKST